MGDAPFLDVLKAVDAAVQRDGRAALCQIIRVEGSTPGKPGWKLLLEVGGTATGNLGGGAFEALVKADAAGKLAEPMPRSELKRYYFTEKALRGESTGMVCGGLAEVFIEVIGLSPVLVVCGGGPVGQSLARAGDLAGLDVVVVDDRDEFLRADRFPESTRRERVDRGYGGDFLADLEGRELYVAVVSRCWETDTAAICGVLRQQPRQLSYLGLMGSRRKIAKVREAVAKAGFDFADWPVYAPIGLPLGGSSPGEIAVSIAAQVVALRSGRGAGLEVGEATTRRHAS